MLKESYGYFCSHHLEAVAIYKDYLKDKKFASLMKVSNIYIYWGCIDCSQVVNLLLDWYGFSFLFWVDLIRSILFIVWKRSKGILKMYIWLCFLSLFCYLFIYLLVFFPLKIWPYPHSDYRTGTIKFYIFYLFQKCILKEQVRRLSIPECITYVTIRMTKYPLLIEAIIKATKGIT